MNNMKLSLRNKIIQRPFDNYSQKMRKQERSGSKLQFFIATLVATLIFQFPTFTAARQGSLRSGGKFRFNLGQRFRKGSLSEEAYSFDGPKTTIFSTTTSSVYNFNRDHLPVGIESTTTTRTSNIASQDLEKEAFLSTKAADLAKQFEQALVAVNKDSQDVHVGQLLLACGKLENTMREIGFTQSANDISGNVQKIRNVYDRLPKDKRDSMSTIVQFEIDSGVHGDKYKQTLKDPSATMGLLWLGRSINYQYDMFHHMLDDNEEPYDAAIHAYEKDLKPHLSWPLQKVCQAAMTRLKPLKKDEIFSRIGGFSEDSFGSQEEQATKRDLRQVMNTWKPMLSKLREVFTDFELDEM